MTIKEIYVEAMFTKSLPNYQNYKPTAGVRIALEEGESEQEAYKRAWEIVNEQIYKQLKAFEEAKPGQFKRGI